MAALAQLPHAAIVIRQTWKCKMQLAWANKKANDTEQHLHVHSIHVIQALIVEIQSIDVYICMYIYIYIHVCPLQFGS